MTSEEYVKSVYPEAECSGPVELYWPPYAPRRKYIVTATQYSSQSLGEGDTCGEAWDGARAVVQEHLYWRGIQAE